MGFGVVLFGFGMGFGGFVGFAISFGSFGGRCLDRS